MLQLWRDFFFERTDEFYLCLLMLDVPSILSLSSTSRELRTFLLMGKEQEEAPANTVPTQPVVSNSYHFADKIWKLLLHYHTSMYFIRCDLFSTSSSTSSSLDFQEHLKSILQTKLKPEHEQQQTMLTQQILKEQYQATKNMAYNAKIWQQYHEELAEKRQKLLEKQQAEIQDPSVIQSVIPQQKWCYWLKQYFIHFTMTLNELKRMFSSKAHSITLTDYSKVPGISSDDLTLEISLWKHRYLYLNEELRTMNCSLLSEFEAMRDYKTNQFILAPKPDDSASAEVYNHRPAEHAIMQLKPGNLLEARYRPCLLKEIGISKTGKGGHRKARLVGFCVFTGRKYDEIVPANVYYQSPPAEINKNCLIVAKTIGINGTVTVQVPASSILLRDCAMLQKKVMAQQSTTTANNSTSSNGKTTTTAEQQQTCTSSLNEEVEQGITTIELPIPANVPITMAHSVTVLTISGCSIVIDSHR